MLINTVFCRLIWKEESLVRRFTAPARPSASSAAGCRIARSGSSVLGGRAPCFSSRLPPSRPCRLSSVWRARVPGKLRRSWGSAQWLRQTG